MIVIVNITGENNGRNFEQNYNLIAPINCAATILKTILGKFLEKITVKCQGKIMV